ncbi:hypothetical protein SISNIDRAFT_481063 [Sistotremastrum niveocremeum HHB9708]|uniref:DNA helicase n=1 Tax=Sistotremastrum niveocremeum HHB9708 TaxID=1314777 RepID=A0A165A084_9AGAM|nr:hypothetical protein SISNIDRAFT_481063 [Sistotremastrum niveocremeum HHB9708]
MKAKALVNGSVPNMNHGQTNGVLAAERLAVPTQSRDGSKRSRYIPPPPPPRTSTIIVPDSSPSSQSIGIRPTGPSPALPSFVSNPSLRQSQYFEDPLSASSGFMRSSAPMPTNPSSPFSNHTRVIRVNGTANDRDVSLKRDFSESNGPPSSSNGMVSDSSPEIRRFGKRRRVNGITIDSDESSGETPSLDGQVHQTSRIIRKVATPSSDSPKPPVNGVKLQTWLITNPTESRERATAAFERTGGDVNAARALLNDPSFYIATPRPPPLSEHPSSSQDATNAARAQERALAREKAAKSSIYARRKTLGDTQQPVEPIIVPSSPPSPLTVPRPVPGRRKAKKMLVDSESEAEWEQDPSSDIEMIESNNARSQPKEDSNYEDQALKWFNRKDPQSIMEMTGCTRVQADAICARQPYTSVADLKTKLGQGKKKAGPQGISPNLFDECVLVFAGYGAVDMMLDGCERIGSDLDRVIKRWTTPDETKGKQKEGALEDNGEGALSLVSLPTENVPTRKGYIRQQPKLLSDTIKLKDYQLTGINWLNLLHSKHHSCILADEMGLGKTVQVIAFLAHLKEQGMKGPYLVVVPSSTLENWCREFERFAPSIAVQTYYAGKNERPELREKLRETQPGRAKDCWEVLITTYNLVQGDEKDLKFFRRIHWEVCVFDEGHILKNFQSKRYTSLMKISSKWRLLLTGTPLQNNLQELVSVMNFALPDLFDTEGVTEGLRTIFNVKADSETSFLSRERVSRAKKMMTPFVLRRRKDQVLKDLPNKFERIEWCEMTPMQKSIYRESLKRSRKVLLESQPEDEAAANGVDGPAKKSKPVTKAKAKLASDSSTNVLMDLRKAASHPMLFRRMFNDDEVLAMAKRLVNEPEYRKRGALLDLVREDMEVMTDSELQAFCEQTKCIRKFAKPGDLYLEAGKITTLLKLLEKYQQEGRRVLIFSQFTQVLDILKAVLRYKSTKFLVLTGSTAVDVRQSLVDEFNEDDTIPIFLLSTKAGGMGINLTAASVVILFDQDFNPHNDRQAADRAYRIGQTRDVDVVKLITKSTIEEDMLKLGQTKLALDEAVAGEDNERGESNAEKIMKSTLMNTLRQQLAEEEKNDEIAQ